MADFYVVGGAAYAPASGRNGSQAAPWVWGVDSVVGAGKWGGGDVLHLVPGSGWDALPAIFSVPNHIGASNDNRAVIDGGGVVELKFVNPAHYVYNVRSNTVFRNFKHIHFISAIGAANCSYVDIAMINSGTNATGIDFGNGYHYNLRIARVNFSNPTAPTLGGTRGAVVWRPTPTTPGGMTAFTMEDCRFENYVAIRSLVCFMTEESSVIRAQDIVMRRLTFKNVTGLAIDLECAGPQSNPSLAVKGTPGWSAGVIIEDIKVENQTCQTLTPNGYFGGALFCAGFGLSPTPGFGPNFIGPIRAKNIAGDAGLADMMYGTYIGKPADFDDPDYPNLRGKSLWVDGMSTPNIDGVVLLLDIGCYNCRFEGIYARNLSGGPKTNSGSVITVLDGVTNCVVSGIDADNVRDLVYCYGLVTDASVTVSNVTATNVQRYGTYISAGSLPKYFNQVKLINSVCSGPGMAVRNDSPSKWTGEDNNYINMATPMVNHTLGASTKSGVDPMLHPTTRRPKTGSPLLRAGRYAGTRLRDATGRRFKLPAAIGAYDEQMTPRSVRA